jgi:RHS repeat-associated protein
VQTRSFNTRHQITGIAANHGGSGLLNLSFGYGNPGQNDGRIRSRTDALQSEHSVQYTFDSGGRLTQAINDSWSVGWDYDVWANRLSQSPTGLATSRVGSQALAYWNNQNTAFSYDAAGNVTNDTIHNYAYDGESRMVQGDGGAIVYGYDFAGRRVRKTVEGQTTFYLYGIGGLLSEFTTADTGATGWSANDRTRYIVSEQTGTPVLAIAQDGLVEENNRVFPFGESWLWETGTPFDPQFTSYLRDDETGLDYAMARSYASRVGRFVTSDPGHVGAKVLNPQSWNAYAYTANDPINRIDPYGTDYEVLVYGSPGGRFQMSDEGYATLYAEQNGQQGVTLPPPEANPNEGFFGNIMGFYMGRLGEVHYVLTDAQRFAMEMSKRVDASNQFLAAAAGGSAVIGAGAALLPVAGTAVVRVAATSLGRREAAKVGIGAVIGSYPGYLEAGKAIGAKTFNLPMPIYKPLEYLGQAWTANRAFLDAVIARGEQIYLTEAPLLKPGFSVSYQKELAYLTSKGVDATKWIMLRN